MKKWAFVILAGLVLAACGDKETATGGPAAAEQQTFKWKLVTTWPKNYPGLGTGPEHFAELVERMSDGQDPGLRRRRPGARL